MAVHPHELLFRRFVEDLRNRGDLDLADTLFARDAVYYLSGVASPMRGPAGIKHVVAMFRSAFPDFHSTVDEVLIDGDRLAAWLTNSGTHLGELPNVQPSGLRATWSAVHFVRFAADQIIEQRTVFNQLALLHQLHFVPSDVAFFSAALAAGA